LKEKKKEKINFM